LQPKTEDNSIAVIPARAGSKRVPGKNIRPFQGRPMIAFAIKTAVESKIFERVIVSTDSNEIAEVAKKEGAEVPFLRPSEISGDHTTTAEVLKHALIEIGADAKYKFACCIYPAVPFLMISDVKAGLELLHTKDAKSTLAISEFGSSVWRAFEEFSDHKLKMIWPEHSVVRTQDLPSAFHDAGQFYWVQVEEFLKKPQFFTNKTYGIKIPKWRSHDIDTKDDWERAEVIYKALQVRENL
jgi:pseudaminic acid cytidylyltransferase